MFATLIRPPRFWPFVPAAAAVLAVVIFTTTALAAPINDTKAAWHYYGGNWCNWGGSSQLADAGGSTGYSGTAIVSSACLDGYRELYVQARTTTNQVLTKYSNWVTYNYSWLFPGYSNLCSILGNHRMSKAGVDTSSYFYTFPVGCTP